jgi:hypothetical protein
MQKILQGWQMVLIFGEVGGVGSNGEIGCNW